MRSFGDQPSLRRQAALLLRLADVFHQRVRRTGYDVYGHLIYNVVISITRTFKSFAWLLLVLPLMFALGYLGSLSVRIARESTHDEARKADVIIVMGAAEYSGRPSPVLKARLDHALVLFSKGLAPTIMTTGGAGGDPQFTEGTVGRAYLIDRGVPSERIVVESEGNTTVYSIAAAAEIMRRMGLHSCILVSDGYHIFRAKRMMEDKGIAVFGSPRYSQPQSSARRYWLYMKQAVGYALWKIGLSV